MTLIPIGSPDERTAILRLWDQRQDTFVIGRLLHRAEDYIERQLHLALERRRAVKTILRKRAK